MDLINLVFDYIPADYIIIIAGLIVLGEIFKNFTTLPNYFLTTALPLVGAFVTGIIYVTSSELLITADLIKQICVGLLMGWAATGGYEWFKNTFLARKEEKKVIAIESVNKDTEKNNGIFIEPKEENVENSQENEEKVEENNQ